VRNPRVQHAIIQESTFPPKFPSERERRIPTGARPPLLDVARVNSTLPARGILPESTLYSAPLNLSLPDQPPPLPNYKITWNPPGVGCFPFPPGSRSSENPFDDGVDAPFSAPSGSIPLDGWEQAPFPRPRVSYFFFFLSERTALLSYVLFFFQPPVGWNYFWISLGDAFFFFPSQFFWDL